MNYVFQFGTESGLEADEARETTVLRTFVYFDNF
jgi:hypothetical protein